MRDFRNPSVWPVFAEIECEEPSSSKKHKDMHTCAREIQPIIASWFTSTMGIDCLRMSISSYYSCLQEQTQVKDLFKV